MASNFTVVLFQRQHFGRVPNAFDDVEPDVPFAGQARSFTFDCPNVQPDEAAFVMFQSRDVDHPRNVFEVNGVCQRCVHLARPVPRQLDL